MMRLRLAIVCCVAMLVGCAEERTAPVESALIVFAAASMTDAMTEICDAYAARTGRQVLTSFAASSTLARQIETGAHADVFVSADQQWMNALVEADRIDASTRFDLAGNRLAMVAPIDGPPIMVEFDSTFNLAGALPGAIAMADPSHVPAGRYAREAFAALGWWQSIERRILTAPDVRAALRLVEMGEAPVGVVYTSDVRASDGVRVVGLIPEALHTPIRYPAAACVDARDGARELLAFMRSDDARRILLDAGLRQIAPAAESAAP